jgi:DNA-binding LytR/AlgR family response regulator
MTMATKMADTQENTNLSAKDLKVMIVCNDSHTEKELKEILVSGGIRDLGSSDEIKALKKMDKRKHPDLLFIGAAEYRKMDGNGFRLRDWQGNHFNTVVIGNRESEMPRLEFGTVTYLTQPLEYRKVENLVSNYLSMKKLENIEQSLSKIKQAVHPPKLKFSTRTGHIFLEPEEIIYLKADSNYTHVYLRNGKHITVSRSLRTFQVGLEDNLFARISRSAIININYLKEVDRVSKKCLLQVNDQQFKLSLSGSYAKQLLDKYHCC